MFPRNVPISGSQPTGVATVHHTRLKQVNKTGLILLFLMILPSDSN